MGFSLNWFDDLPWDCVAKNTAGRKVCIGQPQNEKGKLCLCRDCFGMDFHKECRMKLRREEIQREDMSGCHFDSRTCHKNGQGLQIWQKNRGKKIWHTI